VLVLAGKLKVGQPMVCCCFLKLQTNSFIRSIYYNRCMLIA